MKILKIFGIVVGIHVFALVLIFANPGCSSSSKPTPAPADTVATADASSTITVPNTGSGSLTAPPSAIAFNPDAPASAAPTGVRFTPTRPNTPAASTLVVEPVKDVTPMTTYTVKSGDSLWSIANKNKLTVQELAAANNLTANVVLKLGQKLIIPGKGPAPSLTSTPAATSAAVEATAKPNGSTMKHTVRSGETLGAIAQRYGVKQRDLAIANNITDPLKLPAGKELVIPGWDAANGKSSTKGSTKSGATAPKTATESKPTFATPQLEQPPVILAAPPAQPMNVPVIRVDETAPKNP